MAFASSCINHRYFVVVASAPIGFFVFLTFGRIFVVPTFCTILRYWSRDARIYLDSLCFYCASQRFFVQLYLHACRNMSICVCECVHADEASNAYLETCVMPSDEDIYFTLSIINTKYGSAIKTVYS